MYQNQKDDFFPDVTQAKEIKKSASTDLHKWSEDVVNVENRNLLKVNFKFLLVT